MSIDTITQQEALQFLKSIELPHYKIAGLLGMPHATIYRWLTGKGKISPAYLRLIQNLKDSYASDI